MKLIVLAERKARAQNRIAAAASELGSRLERLDVPDELRESLISGVSAPPVKVRNPDIARMFQLEGIAALLEFLLDPESAIERHLRGEITPDESNRLEDELSGSESGESEDSEEPIRSEIMLLTSLTEEQKKAMIEDDIATFADFDFLTADELAEFYGIDAQSAENVRGEIKALLAEPTAATQADFALFELPDSVRESLQAAYPDFEAVASASDDDLLAVEGIGAARVKAIRDVLAELGFKSPDQG